MPPDLRSRGHKKKSIDGFNLCDLVCVKLLLLLRYHDLDLESFSYHGDKLNCIKLYNPGAFGSVCILPTTFSYYVTIRS